jgi:hypothetical protein
VTARLLLANALELIAGVGVVSLLRLPIGVSYLAGLAFVGIVSAELAIVDVPIGWTGLSILAAAGLVAAWRRPPLPPRLELPSPIAFGGAGVLAVLFLRAWPAFAEQPLDTYDAWAMWGMKAKALFLLGGADAGLFASKGAEQLHLDYPLLVPSLDAIASRAMGGFDPRLIHLQFLLVGAAAFAAYASLLRDRTPAWLRWPFLVALAAAPALSAQLLTAYADVPLALFVGAGLVAAARWIDEREPRLLVLATLFFAAAGLTKNEGLIFAGAAYVGLLVATMQWRPLLVSALALELCLAPWQIWLRVNDVHSDTLLGLHVFDIHHPGIGPLALEALLRQIFATDTWTLLVPLFLAGVALAALARARMSIFAAVWISVSLVGLAWIYLVSKQEWSNYFSFSGNRVVDSVVVGAAALAPLLLAEAVGRRR